MDNAWNAVSTSLNSHRAQLAITALASGAVVGSSIIAFQKARQISRLQNIKDDIPYNLEATAVCLHLSTIVHGPS